MDFKIRVLKYLSRYNKLLCLIHSFKITPTVCLPLWSNLVSQLGTTDMVVYNPVGKDRRWISKCIQISLPSCIVMDQNEYLCGISVIDCEWQGRFFLAFISKFLQLIFYKNFCSGHWCVVQTFSEGVSYYLTAK